MAESGSSFQQSSFLGGEWSTLAQGRIDDPRYRTALNSSLNGQPVEEGAWVRRSGRRRLGATAFNAPGIVRTFWLPNHQPCILELTYDDANGASLRFWTQQFDGSESDDLMLLCDNYKKIVSLSNTNPAILTIDSPTPNGMVALPWQNGDVVQIFIDPSVAIANGPGYVNRQFQVIAVPVTGNALWATNTFPAAGAAGLTIALASGASFAPGGFALSPSGQFKLIFQDDGNVVLYEWPDTPSQTALWATGTVGAATELVMQTDGNLVLYNGTTVVWSTGTNGHPGAYLALQNDGNAVIYSLVSSTTQWYLYDAETGAAVDGNSSGMIVVDYGNSYAGHVVRFTLPYGSLDEVRRVRLVQTGQNAYLLSKLRQPYLLAQVDPAPTNAVSSGAVWFTLAPALFRDGPFLDPLPGASQTGNSLGKVTRLKTFSPNTVNFKITDGAYFFQAADIGRSIRIWCQPQPYVGGTYTGNPSNPFPRFTYGGNFYAIGATTSARPGTDATTYLQADFGRYGYGTITAINVDGDPYACTVELINPTGSGGGLDDATIQGNSVTPDGNTHDSAIVDTWQLGVYTLNQYPACGTFWEGRLWFAGAMPNRIDACVSDGGSISAFMTLPNSQNPEFYPSAAAQSNNPTTSVLQAFLGQPTWGSTQSQAGPLGSSPVPGSTLDTNEIFFSPTNASGQVNANHGISLVLNSSEQDEVNFLHPHNDGITIGSVSGEHVLSAADGQGVTPTSAVVRQISKYGAAFVEAVRVGAALIYVQSYGRRLLEYITDFFSHRYVGRHLNEYAKHLTTTGIMELAYQEESAPTIHCAMADGSLASCVYRRLSAFGTEPPTFSGWSRYEFPDSRFVMSLCMGANQAGSLDQLVMLTTDEAIPTLNPIQPLQPPVPPPPPPLPPPLPGCCAGCSAGCFCSGSGGGGSGCSGGDNCGCTGCAACGCGCGCGCGCAGCAGCSGCGGCAGCAGGCAGGAGCGGSGDGGCGGGP